MIKEYLVILEVYRKPEQPPGRYMPHVMAQSDSEARRLAIQDAESKGYRVRKQLACGRI